MHWLSQSAEVLIHDCESADARKEPLTVDVAVVGSGYGGAVAALRFAERGQSVFVLERGQEYVAGEFPNDLSQVGKHVRSEIAATTGVTTQGYEDALFDFRLGYKAGALVGNGLGGGSLINAGVGLRPDAKVFEQDDWPAALRQEDLSPYFLRAEKALELQIPGQAAVGDSSSFDPTDTAKYQRLQDLHGQAARRRSGNDKNIDIRFEPAPIAVQLGGMPRQDLGPRKTCIGCGDCVTGCNTQAKLNLVTTYLPRAVKAGAKLFTGLTVLCVSYEGKDPLHPWVVHYVRTDERRLQHSLEHNRKAGDPSPRDGWVYTLRARRVVLAAGTFGSTEILLRSRKKGLSLSNTALGVGVSSNGDDVAFGYDLKAASKAVGLGSKAKTLDDKPVGPTISGVIRYTDAFDLRRSTLLQDGAVPGLMQGVFHELVTTLGAVAQIGNWRFRPLGDDPLALQAKALQHAMSLLGMGHDSAGGVITFHNASDRIQWGWPKAEQEAAPALHRQRSQPAVQALGGIYIQNPAVSLLPDNLGKVLSGPKPGGSLFTVHPLGGCRMGDSPLTGVVNHWGQAWHADGELHDGLYVMDGSTMPSALGANPMLTITALAERACEKILLGIKAQTAKTRELPSYPKTAPPLTVQPAASPSVVLAEVLRGPLTTAAALANAPESLQLLLGGPGQRSAALFLEFEVLNWPAFFKDPWHRLQVKAESGSAAQRYTASRLVMDCTNAQGQVVSTELQVTSGSVDLFCQRPESWLARWTFGADRWLRTGLTYLIGRWLPDLAKPKVPEPKPSFWHRLAGARAAVDLAILIYDGCKLITNANEVREFHYHLQLCDELGHRYQLRGSKTIEAAASWSALGQCISATGRPAPQRHSLWQQLTQLEMTLTADLNGKQSPVASGRLAMDLPDMLRRVQPQLGTQADSLSALLAFAGYPLLMLRALLKTRLLDLRLPDYKIDAQAKSTLPFTDPALISKPPGYDELVQLALPPLKLANQVLIQPVPQLLQVPLTWPNHSGAAPELINIGLVRYPQARAAYSTVDGLHRVKSVVLINGFLLTGKLFAAEGIYADSGSNLATHLHQQGWDVWLLEYRASPLLDASACPGSMDDIAAFDIPAAVGRICATVSQELALPLAQTQIFAYSRCVGSAALTMSLLSGYLRHAAPGKAPANLPVNPPVNQLAGVLLSDFKPFVVGSVSAQMRLQLSSFLKNVLKMEALEFTAGTAQSGLLYALIDRLLASAHYAYGAAAQDGNAYTADGERCPHESDLRQSQPDTTTCKRISGLMSRSYSHAQLSLAAHERLDEFFGRGNLGVFSQGAKCLEYERLVNADGQNVYLTDQAILQHLNMPLMLLHGELNVLFDKESLAHSSQHLDRVFGRAVHRHLVPGYAHVDLVLGQHAPRDVFPHISAFLAAAYAAPSAAVLSVPRCRARLPRTGPIVGWVRPGKAGGALIRVWIEIDDTYGDTPVTALTVLETGAVPYLHRQVHAWPIRMQTLGTLASAQAHLNAPHPIHPSVSSMVQPKQSALRYAVADIEVPSAGRDQVRLQMLGIHCYAGAPVPEQTLREPQSAPGSAAVALGLPAQWGAPLSIAEVMAAAEPAAAQSMAGYIVHSTPALHAAHHNQPAQAALDPLGGQPIQPLGLTLTEQDAEAFLQPLDKEIDLCRQRTRRADPQTLSRLRRNVPTQEQRQITLQQPQLQDLQCGNLSFFAAACRHPGLTGFEQSRAEASLLAAHNDIEEHHATPAFMLLLGDQIYADARGDLMGTESPIERLLPHYRDAFGTSRGFRKLAQRLPMLMVMDDHEINNNWSQEQARASRLSEVLASNAQAAYSVFQYAHGPGAAVHPANTAQPVPGFNYSYTHSGLPFIVLDTRTQRTRVPARRILHESQWAWLEHWLLAEQKKGSHPKFVVSGSVVVPGLQENAGYHAPRGADSWQMSPTERQRLLHFLVDKKIDNVVFLSSDYHCAAAATISFKHSKIKAWAIAAPPLHAPLRFANAASSSVMPHEQIFLPGDVAEVQSQAWEGEGWLECNVQRQSACCTTLQMRFHVRRLEQAAWPDKPVERNWILQTQARTDDCCAKPLSPETSAADLTRPCPQSACCAAPAQPVPQAQC